MVLFFAHNYLLCSDIIKALPLNLPSKPQSAAQYPRHFPQKFNWIVINADRSEKLVYEEILQFVKEHHVLQEDSYSEKYG